MLTRRTVVSGAAALAAAAAAPGLSSAPAQAQAGAGKQTPAFYRYKVGDIEITAIHEGITPRPIEGLIKNADLADVQEALEDAFLPTDKLQIPYTTLVINSGSKLVLIDTGLGDMAPPTAGMWTANFKAAGFDPKNVGTIVISHFHPDHINGIRRKDGTAVFPNAEVMVPAAEWAFWMDDGKMSQAPEGLKAGFNNVRRVFDPIARDVKRFEAGKEIVPGITSIATHGHTPGHTSFAVTSGSGRFMVMSDVTNHPALFVRNPDWAAVFDMDAEMARASRHKMLDMVAAERMQVAFYHAPFPATGHIAKESDGFEFVPIAWNPVL